MQNGPSVYGHKIKYRLVHLLMTIYEVTNAQGSFRANLLVGYFN